MGFLKEKTVLLVESREELRERIKDAFAEKKVRWVEIGTTEDAVVAVMTELPDLVILALEMDDGDGVALLKNMRIMNAEVPMIALVGVPTKEKVVECKLAGVVDVVVKPPDMDRLLCKSVEVLWPDAEYCETTLLPDEPEPEPFVEAVPKGAEVLNINDAIAGMKVARTLVFNDVVFADKGQILTEAQLKQLNRMGVAEICVYINADLKRMAAERKKRMLQQVAIKAAEKSVGREGEKVFSTIKRDAVRVPTDITSKLVYKDKDGLDVEETCLVVDLSAGGCAIVTQSRLNKDAQIFLTFMIDGMEIKNIRGVVRHSVTRGAKPPQYPYRAGIYFDSVTERFREELITKLFKVQREMKQKGIPKYIE